MSETSTTPPSSSLASPAPADITPRVPTEPRRTARAWLGPWTITLACVGLIVILIGVLMARSPAPLAPPPKQLTGVATLTVTPRQHYESLELPARLEADRSAVLSCELSGRLQAWMVEEGAAVEAGQELARLNPDDLDAQVRQMEARRDSAAKTVAVAEESLSLARVAVSQAEKNVDALNLDLGSARAGLDLATKEFDRVKTLAAAEVATPSDYDRTENVHTLAQFGVAKAENAIALGNVTVAAARAAVTHAEAALALNRSQVLEAERQLEALKVTLAKTHLYAPFAGRFEEHLVEAGEVVAVGQPLGRLYDLTWVRAAVDVPDRYGPLLDTTSALVQKYIDAAMPGAVQDIKATLTIPGLPKLTGGTYAGIELPAAIQRVAQAASPTSNTFRVELRLPNPGNALKEGILGQARLSFLRYDQAILIPVKAVQVTEIGPRVLVVENVDGRAIARVRDIEPISIQNDEMLVRGGLTANDRLIVSGAKGILDGEEVTVVIADGNVLPRPESKPTPARLEPGPAALPAAGEAPR